MPTLKELIDQRVAAGQESSDYVGLHKFTLDALGLGVRGATYPLRAIIGDEPVYKTLGAVGTVLGAVPRAGWATLEGAARGEDLGSILKRAGNAFVNQGPASAKRFLDQLGLEDPTGISSFVLETAADVATGGLLNKAAKLAGAQAVKSIPPLARHLEEVGKGKVGGQRLQIPGVEAERVSQQLAQQVNIPIQRTALEKFREARGAKAEAQKIGAEIEPLVEKYQREWFNRGERLPPGQTTALRFEKEVDARWLPLREKRLAELEAEIAPLVTARQAAWARHEELLKEVQTLRESRVAEVIGFKSTEKLSKEGLAELTWGSLTPITQQYIRRAVADEWEITGARTFKQIRESGATPGWYSFEGRADRVWKNLPAENDLGSKIAIEFRRVTPKDTFPSFFYGRFISMRNRMDKIGFLRPLTDLHGAYSKEKVAVLKEFQTRAKAAGVWGTPAEDLIRDHLDGLLDDAALSPAELGFSQWVRGRLDDAALRAGYPMEKLQARPNYWPHSPEDYSFFTKGFGGKYYGHDIPEYVRNKFFMKRTGETVPYNLREGFEAYMRVTLKKAYYDGFLQETAPFLSKLTPGLQNDANIVINSLLGAPHAFDEGISNMVASVTGAQFTPGQINRWATATVMGAYRGVLWGNVGQLLLQTSQAVNTAARMGFGRTMQALIHYMKDPAARTSAKQSIQSAFHEFQRPLTTGRFGRALHTMDDYGFLPLEFGDRFARGIAHVAGAEEAVARGWPVQFALAAGKRVEQDTQFVFGALSRSMVANSGIGRIFYQFAQYPANLLTMLLNDVRNSEYGNLFRYILGVGMVSKIADNAGIDLTQVEQMPMTLDRVGEYLNFTAQPVVRMWTALGSTLTTDFDDPKQSERWAERMAQATRAFVPILPRLGLQPGGANQLDLSGGLMDPEGYIPLRNQRGQVTRYLTPAQYGARTLGVRTSRETYERELTQRMLDDQAHFVHVKQDLMDAVVKKLMLNQDVSGEVLVIASMTGDSMKQIMSQVRKAIGRAQANRVDRIYENLPSALKQQYLGEVSRLPGSQSGFLLNEGGMP